MDIPVKNVSIDGKNSFLIRLIWNGDIGEVTIFDFQNITTWIGRITREYCIETANILQMDLADYKMEISQGLSQAATVDGKHNYRNHFSNDVLLLKKTECASQITYKIAALVLKDIPANEILPDFMSAVASYLNQLVIDAAKRDELILELSQERTILKEKYENSAAKIQDNSSNLYAQFAVAFNSLKERLKSEETLGQLTDMSSVNEGNSEKEEKSDLVESDDSYEGSTDIDTEENT